MFNHKENDWGFSHFLSWDDATDPAKGYCTPEISLTLEATYMMSHYTSISIPTLSGLEISIVATLII